MTKTPAGIGNHGPFTCVLALRWSDQDANGHVNNARIVTLMEEARITAHQVWLGSVPHPSHPRVVRKLSVDYRRPIHYGVKLTARVWISHLGTSSFTVHHELHQGQELCASGQAVIVQLTPDASRSEPLSAHVRSSLEAALLPRPAV